MKQPSQAARNLAKKKAGAKSTGKGGLDNNIVSDKDGWDPGPLTSRALQEGRSARATHSKRGKPTGQTTVYYDKGEKEPGLTSRGSIDKKGDWKNGTPYATTTPIKSRRGNAYNMNTYGPNTWAEKG